LITRALQRGEERAPGLRQAHGWFREIAQHLEPTPDPITGDLPTGAQVRERVERDLAEMGRRRAHLPEWLRQPVEQFQTILLRLGEYLYRCYDVPGLPRTDNDLEQFYRRVKATERRITGHRRSDAFVVRMGGFAVYAIAARGLKDSTLLSHLAGVSPKQWQAEREALHSIQERQTKMRRFRLHREAYLADLETRWDQLSEAKPP
jgi:hypothetical protein